MKRLFTFVLVSFLALSVFAAPLTKKEQKQLKKEAKALASEGWKSCGEKSVLEQVTAVYEYTNMLDKQGEPVYYVATAWQKTSSQRMSATMAISTCKMELVKKFAQEFKGKIDKNAKIRPGRIKVLSQLQKDEKGASKVMVTMACNREDMIKLNINREIKNGEYLD